MLVCFIDWVVGVKSDRVWVVLYRPPKVRDETITVVDGLCVRRVWTLEQDSATTIKRLHVIRDIPEAIPYEISYARLTTETTGRVP